MEPVTMREGFDGLYGLEVTEHGEGVVRARVAVGDQHKQPAGLVHGGVFAAMAEATASMATYLAVHQDGRVAVGQSNHTSFLRPILAGHVHALARARHRGRTTWVWDVEFSDDDERLCALSRVTIAVREAPPGGGGSDQPR
jgi:1,4-dihydroxy-2-naphthoyl-CoA hydrolase